MKLQALLVVSVGLLLAAQSGGGDASSDSKKLQGTWKMVSGEKDGKEIPEDVIKSARLVIKGDKHYVKVGEELFVGTHKLDATTKPKSIDAMDTEGPGKGKTMLGIYEIKGDEFKVCFGEPDSPRPKKFTSKNGFIHVWKRVKK